MGYALEAYPVGSIYMSVNSTDPSTFFGGSWERIQGRFLLSADSTYAAGSTGGEAEHTLTVDEMPSHSHTITGATNISGKGSVSFEKSGSSFSGATGSTGDGKPHNNMPPYLAVYIWKRTA